MKENKCILNALSLIMVFFQCSGNRISDYNPTKSQREPHRRTDIDSKLLSILSSAGVFAFSDCSMRADAEAGQG